QRSRHPQRLGKAGIEGAECRRLGGGRIVREQAREPLLLREGERFAALVHLAQQLGRARPGEIARLRILGKQQRRRGGGEADEPQQRGVRGDGRRRGGGSRELAA